MPFVRALCLTLLCSASLTAFGQQGGSEDDDPDDTAAAEAATRPGLGSSRQDRGDTSATEEVPGWAEDWRYIWLDAKKNGPLRLSATLTHPVVAPGANELFAVLEVRSINFPQERRAAVNAALILDRSASMKGARLNILKKAAIDLVSTLGPKDRLAIVRVSDETEVLDSQLCTAENKQAIVAFIQEMTGQGGSDLSAGLADAYEQVQKHKKQYVFHRVLLISDGRPNKGMADPDGLADIARRVRESENIHTSTLTIGHQSDVELMRGIAVQGWGFTGNLEDASQLFRVGRRLENDLIRKAAEDVQLILKPAEGVNVTDVLEYAADVAGDQLVVPLHEVAHKETLRVVLRLTANAGADGAKLPILRAVLRYHDMLVDRTQEAEVDLAATVSGDPRKTAAAIDGRAMLLAARAVASRGRARALDRHDEGFDDDAKSVLEETREFLRRTSEQTGIVIDDEVAQLDRTEERLFPKKAPPPGKTNGKKKKKKSGRG